MKPNHPIAGLTVLATAVLAALSTTSRAQFLDRATIVGGLDDGTPPLVAPEPVLPAFQILETKTVQLSDHRLIIHRVADPGLPRPQPPAATVPAVVRPPLLSPAELAARRAALVQTRMLSLSVTRHADDLYYIEWYPGGGAGPFGAWSRADFQALSMVQEVAVAPGNIRYLIFPFFVAQHRPRAGTPVVPPQIPGGGPGFVIVKGNPADAENIKPVAALHEIHQSESARLRQTWALREQRRQQEAAALLAQPPRPPEDDVTWHWEVKTKAPRFRRGGAR